MTKENWKTVAVWLGSHLYKLIKLVVDYIVAAAIVVLAADDIRTRLAHKVVNPTTAFGIGLFLVGLGCLRLVDRVFEKNKQ